MFMKCLDLKYLGKKVLAAVLGVLVLASGAPYTAMAAEPSDTQKELDSLNSQYNTLEKQQKDLEKKISKAKTDKERKEAEKLKTESDIKILEKQIDILISYIDIMKKEVEHQKESIAALENDIDSSKSVFKNRVKLMYMNDTATALGVVLGADSYYEYLSLSDFVTRVAVHDKKLIDELVDKKNEQLVAETELNDSLAQLKNAEDSIYKKSEELDTILSKTTDQIHSLESLEQQYKANAEEVSRRMAAMKAEIDEVYRKLEEEKKNQNAADMEYVGGGFAYPLAYFPNRKITSYYGWRFGGTDFHTGIDIAGAGANGQPVRASNDGKVVYVKDTYIYGVGYGKYIIVDHGGGYTTLYAHLQSIECYVGQTVKKGEIIGRVGNTGWSTGPHLHFEIRINNKHTNPLDHLPPLTNG